MGSALLLPEAGRRRRRAAQRARGPHGFGRRLAVVACFSGVAEVMGSLAATTETCLLVHTESALLALDCMKVTLGRAAATAAGPCALDQPAAWWGQPAGGAPPGGGGEWSCACAGARSGMHLGSPPPNSAAHFLPTLPARHSAAMAPPKLKPRVCPPGFRSRRPPLSRTRQRPRPALAGRACLHAYSPSEPAEGMGSWLQPVATGAYKPTRRQSGWPGQSQYRLAGSY